MSFRAASGAPCGPLSAMQGANLPKLTAFTPRNAGCRNALADSTNASVCASRSLVGDCSYPHQPTGTGSVIAGVAVAAAAAAAAADAGGVAAVAAADDDGVDDALCTCRRANLLTVSELVTCCKSDTAVGGCVLPLVVSSDPTPTDADGLLPVPSPPFGTATCAALTTPLRPVPLFSGPFDGIVPLVVLPVLPVLQLLPLLLILIPLVVRPFPQPPLSVLSWAARNPISSYESWQLLQLQSSGSKKGLKSRIG
uniref:Uncharacterized protein n=1 Tax=Anopheles farauti TaxID=69004 RepID=A0A182QQ27_9DIPT